MRKTDRNGAQHTQKLRTVLGKVLKKSKTWTTIQAKQEIKCEKENWSDVANLRYFNKYVRKHYETAMQRAKRRCNYNKNVNDTKR